MGSPQTTYTLNNRAGLPGMLFDKDTGSSFLDSKPCGAVAIAAGTVVELVNGLLQIAQGTGDPNSNVIWGVAVYLDSLEPNPTANGGIYTQGMDVVVLRRGRIWALLDTGVTFGGVGVPVNYTHSSNATHGQGTFTNAVNSGTIGFEVSALTAIWWKDGGLVGANPSVAAVALNLV